MRQATPTVLTMPSGFFQIILSGKQDPGDPGEEIEIPSQYQPNYDVLYIACDDFQLSEESVISGISYYGNYWYGNIAPYSSAHLLFYTSSSDSPAQYPIYDETFSYADTGETLWASPYICKYTIPTIPYFAAGDQVYWVGVYVELYFPPSWGLYYSSDHWGSVILEQSEALFDDLDWHPNEYNADWAFELFAPQDSVKNSSLGGLKALFN